MNFGFLGLDSGYKLDPVAILAVIVSVYAVMLSRKRAQLDDDMLRADINLTATKLRSALEIALPITERNPSSIDADKFSKDCVILKAFNEAFRQNESLITKSFSIAPKLADDILSQIKEIKLILSNNNGSSTQLEISKKICRRYKHIFFLLSQFSKPVSIVDNNNSCIANNYEDIFFDKYFEFENRLSEIGEIESNQLRLELQLATDKLKRL